MLNNYNYVISILLIPPLFIGLIAHFIAKRGLFNIFLVIFLPYISLSLLFTLLYRITTNPLVAVIYGPYYSLWDKIFATYPSDILECTLAAMVFTPICLCCAMLLLGNKSAKVFSAVCLFCYNMFWGLLGLVAQAS